MNMRLPKLGVLMTAAIIAACSDADFSGEYSTAGVDDCGGNSIRELKLINITKSNSEYVGELTGPLTQAFYMLGKIDSIPTVVRDDGNLEIRMKGETLGSEISLLLEPGKNADEFWLTKFDLEMSYQGKLLESKNFLKNIAKGDPERGVCLRKTKS